MSVSDRVEGQTHPLVFEYYANLPTCVIQSSQLIYIYIYIGKSGRRSTMHKYTLIFDQKKHSVIVPPKIFDTRTPRTQEIRCFFFFSLVTPSPPPPPSTPENQHGFLCLLSFIIIYTGRKVPEMSMLPTSQSACAHVKKQGYPPKFMLANFHAQKKKPEPLKTTAIDIII